MSRRKAGADRAGAEAIGLRALIYLAEDPGRLNHFMAETGIDPSQLQAKAGEPETLAAVLDHVTRDESLLLVFAASADLKPDEVMLASAVLSGDIG